MKKMKFLILIALGTILSADYYNCSTQWIQENDKKYLPPESLKQINIELIFNTDMNRMSKLDVLKFSTKNITSVYKYDSFLDIKGNLGISYRSNNQILDIFQNGNLILWKDRTPLLKAKCPTIKLDILKP